MDSGILIVVGIIYIIIMIGAIALFIHFKRKGAFRQTIDSNQEQTLNKRDEQIKQ
ncbi:hypothetical protein NST62_09050 [Ureibacillus sp. FSL K6-8385]|uniref:hypothetical protein n=1 Tax=Ureibacillus TaxID=160795 RepID=UPI0015EFBE5E|nr:hypothetical protein [Ureibacillus terrenus]MED3662557.1 hypothetical protein [Ureibacillus terrenus]MED3764862.1 hypothetical protein [Ureibacillus terrenus]